VASVLLLVPAWLICGMVLAAAVQALVPERFSLQNDIRLSGPRSGAYQAVDVIVQGSAWEGELPAMGGRLELVPLPAGGAQTAPAKPPPPLAVTQATRAEAVLQWLGRAGVDTGNPLVRDEAQAVTMNALRGLRARQRMGYGGYTSNSMLGQDGGPFAQVSTTVRGGSGHSDVSLAAFGLLWVGVFAAAVSFLWRVTRGRGRPPA
jgi:hypothetical protein